jgi:hypothetical protein
MGDDTPAFLSQQAFDIQVVALSPASIAFC